MKQILIAFGCIFLVLVIVVVILISFATVKGKALDTESRVYVNKVVPIILEDLNKDKLFEYSSKELINSASTEEFDNFFVLVKKLGEFKGAEDAVGGARISYMSNEDNNTTAQYKVNAEFETGQAVVSIGIVKRDEKWLITGFRIDSDALM